MTYAEHMPLITPFHRPRFWACVSSIFHLRPAFAIFASTSMRQLCLGLPCSPFALGVPCKRLSCDVLCWLHESMAFLDPPLPSASINTVSLQFVPIIVRPVVEWIFLYSIHDAFLRHDA